MSIIHMNSAAAVLKSMLRECPGCHEKQSVALSKAKETVTCKKCGTTIPPKASGK